MKLKKTTHKGTLVAKKDKYKVVDCQACGFKHLDPIPTERELVDFYQKKYYNLIKVGGRAPELRRQIAGGREAQNEMKWLKSTLYKDIIYILSRNCKKRKRRLLDIGCGMGDFIRVLKGFGWEVTGIEPSEEAAKNAKNSDLTIYNMSLEKFLTLHSENEFKFHAVTLINVLEHVPNPKEFLQHTKKLLQPQEGLLCVRVPNDFNKFQFYAERKLKKSAWWVSVPDHINYFNFGSLRTLLKSLNFEIIYSSVDFPMEFFLLMGEDYIGNPNVGNLCHTRRVSFELALSDVTRRNFYQNLAKIGVGRDCLIVARLNGI
jgi:2-polyprenyl-3-methyl-5-hydroxy-6-metoxy-1,4-benzoquinol methylase